MSKVSCVHSARCAAGTKTRRCTRVGRPVPPNHIPCEPLLLSATPLHSLRPLRGISCSPRHGPHSSFMCVLAFPVPGSFCRAQKLTTRKPWLFLPAQPALLLATLCLAPSSLASLDRRQAETAALSALTSGPVAYVGYTASCTTSCAAMTSAANVRPLYSAQSTHSHKKLTSLLIRWDCSRARRTRVLVLRRLRRSLA